MKEQFLSPTNRKGLTCDLFWEGSAVLYPTESMFLIPVLRVYQYIGVGKNDISTDGLWDKKITSCLKARG